MTPEGHSWRELFMPPNTVAARVAYLCGVATKDKPRFLGIYIGGPVAAVVDFFHIA
jgi:hypothetical protein